MNSLNMPLGKHVLADLYGARALFDPLPAKDILSRAARAAGASVLEVNTHDFGKREGFTGVALLAESHISVHTWPEHGYAAIDIFMCGDAEPQRSLKILQDYFAPARSQVQTITRGPLRHRQRRLAAAGF